MSENEVRWPRVKELLDNIMERWERKEGRKALLKEIHGSSFVWDTPQQLANCVTYKRTLIEPGVPGRETSLVVFLSTGVGSVGRMPLFGPFLKDSEIDEVVRWIDAGMPE